MTLKSENSILSDDFVETNLRRFFVSEEADKSEKTKKPILYFVFVSVTNETLTKLTEKIFFCILYFVFCILYFVFCLRVCKDLRIQNPNFK